MGDRYYKPTLPAEVKERIQSLVDKGLYRSIPEFILEAVRLRLLSLEKAKESEANA